MDIQRAYKTLQITDKASRKEIKQAYRKLAMQYHPDKNRSPNAINIFIEVSEAYEVLTNITTPRKPTNTYKPPKFRDSNYQQAVFNSYDYTSENERSRRARDIYEYEFAKQSNELYIKIFSKYKKTNQRKIAIIFALIGVFVSSIFIYDYTAPTINTTILNNSKPNIEVSYRKYGNINCKYQNSEFAISTHDRQIIMEPKKSRMSKIIVSLEQTPILRNTVSLKINNAGNNSLHIYPTSNKNIYFWTFPILFFLLFPLISFLFEKPTFNFVFFIMNYNLYGFPIALFFIILYATPIMWFLQNSLK